MYKGLSPGAIGVKCSSLSDGIAMARKFGFGGVEVSASEVADLVDRDGAPAVRNMFKEAGIQPAGAGLTVDWRTTDANYKKGLEALPRLAWACNSVGVNRMMTWIMPGSNERDFDANRR